MTPSSALTETRRVRAALICASSQKRRATSRQLTSLRSRRNAKRSLNAAGGRSSSLRPSSIAMMPNPPTERGAEHRVQQKPRRRPSPRRSGPPSPAAIVPPSRQPERRLKPAQVRRAPRRACPRATSPRGRARRSICRWRSLAASDGWESPEGKRSRSTANHASRAGPAPPHRTTPPSSGSVANSAAARFARSQTEQ